MIESRAKNEKQRDRHCKTPSNKAHYSTFLTAIFGPSNWAYDEVNKFLYHLLYAKRRKSYIRVQRVQFDQDAAATPLSLTRTRTRIRTLALGYCHLPTSHIFAWLIDKSRATKIRITKNWMDFFKSMVTHIEPVYYPYFRHFSSIHPRFTQSQNLIAHIHISSPYSSIEMLAYLHIPNTYLTLGISR